MERILIHQNNSLLKEIVGDLRVYLAPLNKLKEAYEALEMGNFSQKVFDDLISKGTNEIIAAYSKSLNDQLDKTGVVNTKLRGIVLQGSDEPIANLKKALNDLKEVNPQPRASYGTNPRTQLLQLRDIEHKEGRFQVSDEESLLEKHCRIYVEDEQSKMVYSHLMTLQEHLQAYLKLTTSLGLPRGVFGGTIGDNLQNFFQLDPETLKLSIRPTSISWAVNHKAEQARLHSMYHNI